ncbi:MAG: hypothetical protein KAH57_09550 [Thermoplasmata archaeon]|nr:hypothetical protein [Thermoplasmata archaeon]
MKNMLKEPLFWVIIILFSLSVASFTILLYPNQEEGELNIDWNAPKGVKFNNMQNGDEIQVEYIADSPLSLYFLTQKQADEYRSSTFYKEELPAPLVEGEAVKYEITVDKDGDYELLFWNSSFSRDHSVEYNLEVRSTRERFLTITASIVLLFISIMILIIFIRKRKTMFDDQH